MYEITPAQRSFITSLASQLGINDPDYYLHERFNQYRSTPPKKFVTRRLASEIIDELKQQVAEVS